MKAEMKAMKHENNKLHGLLGKKQNGKRGQE